MSTASPFQFQLAPDQLWQPIQSMFFSGDIAQLGLININLGQTRHPDVERKVLDEVGSYGRQLGHIGDALEVLIAHFDKTGLDRRESDALAILIGELAEIRKVKAREIERKRPG